MFIQFLVEDASGAILIDNIMKIFIFDNDDIHIEYSINSYRGIGGFTKNRDPYASKSDKLLNDLPKRLKAFNFELMHRDDAVVIVVLDNDKRDPSEFLESLESVAAAANITIPYVFCLAVEEMEAWLLGDREALIIAYPEMTDRIITKHASYIQDSICGTWEVLADMLTRGGIDRFKKKNPTFYDVGKCKSDWAENIGQNLSIPDNASPSFSRFIQYIESKCEI